MPQGSEQADAVAARLRDILDAAEGEVRRLLLKMETRPGEATLAATQNNQAVVSQIRRRIASLGALVTEEAAKASAAAATGESRRLGITMEPDVLRVLDAITEDRIKEISATWAAAADEVALSTTPCAMDLASLMLIKVSRMLWEKNRSDMPMMPVMSYAKMLRRIATRRCSAPRSCSTATRSAPR